MGCKEETVVATGKGTRYNCTNYPFILQRQDCGMCEETGRIILSAVKYMVITKFIKYMKVDD